MGDTRMAKPYAETMQAPATAPCVNAMPNSLVNTSAALMSLTTSTTCSGQPAMVIQCGTQRTTQLTAQLEAVVPMTHNAARTKLRQVHSFSTMQKQRNAAMTAKLSKTG